jgi:biotin transporter BioY
LLISNLLNLHAMSAAASAGFLAIFALVNVANARLARQTASKEWISRVAGVACILALGIMIFQIAREPDHSIEVYFLAGLFVLPFVIQVIRRALRP